MSKRIGLMGLAWYRYLAIFLWCFFPLAGLAAGWGLFVLAVGVALSAKDTIENFMRVLFLFALSPFAFTASTALGIWLGLKAWRKGEVGNAD